MGQRLEIRTLGGLTIECDGELITGMRARKGAAILVFLATTKRCLFREVLAEMFWPGRQLSRSLGDLRVTLHSLNQCLSSFVLATRDTIAMNAESDWWIDSAELEQALNPSTNGHRPQQYIATSSLAQAIELYHGDFLDGFFVKDCVNFEHWVTNKREQLRYQTICALDQLLTDCIDNRKYRAGIGYAMRLLHMDPLREKTYRELIMLLVHSGQRTAALTQYDRYQQMLTENWGRSPSLEMTHLLEDVRRNLFW